MSKNKSNNRIRRENKQYVKELKEWLIELKTNKKCNNCDETFPMCLQFHHLNPKDKKFDISTAIHEGYSRSKIENELQKCILLCANCHIKHHYTQSANNIEDKQ